MKLILLGAPGAGKGMAVRWLTAHMGLNRDQVMGFGDYTNDLPMLEVAELAFVPSNATADARSLADVVVGSNDEHALSDVVRYLDKLYTK